MAQNNQINVPTPFAVNKGGTGVTSVTTAPTASAWSGWDANKNASAVGFIPGYTTTVTSASPVTLTVGSNQQQYFTGSTAQTLTMPVASTLVVGMYWTIVNNSSATLTIQSSGSNTILALPANSETTVTCVTASGTTAASWVTSPAVSGSGTVNSGTINQLAYYAATGTAVSGLATANNGVLVTSNTGVPSISSTLPSGIAATNMALTTPNVGNPTNGKLLVQEVYTQTGAVATGTTLIPVDDTIPQNTEGDQYMSLAITPVNSSNILVIEVQAVLASSVATYICGSLFQDSTANALVAALQYQTTVGGGLLMNLQWVMAAGTTSATTFKFRGGGHVSGTVTFNGLAGGRIFGGVMNSYMRIQEFQP